jgi:hypothetical protein
VQGGASASGRRIAEPSHHGRDQVLDRVHLGRVLALPFASPGGVTVLIGVFDGPRPSPFPGLVGVWVPKTRSRAIGGKGICLSSSVRASACTPSRGRKRTAGTRRSVPASPWNVRRVLPMRRGPSARLLRSPICEVNPNLQRPIRRSIYSPSRRRFLWSRSHAIASSGA